MARCLVGCGANLGEPLRQLERAVELVRFMPGVECTAVSRFRETRPVGGPPGQPPYVNGAFLLETDLGPHEVLDMLLAVENTLERRRDERWGPRTVDLDLLLYDDVVLDTEALTLPHPRMATRRFVLEPCAEIAADLRHPGAGCSLRELLADISVPNPLVAIVGVTAAGTEQVAAAVADATFGRVVEVSAAPPADADPEALRAALDAFSAALADAAPQVAILLEATADALERRTGAAAVARVDVGPRGPAVCAPAGATDVTTLLRFQGMLASRVCRAAERLPGAPRAVVSVAADDLDRAVADATAAVEAML